MKTLNRYRAENFVILFLALLSVLIHLSVINNLEFHRDELLYATLGQHPAFGYNSVPPLIGWIAWLTEKIFGTSLLALRICPAICGGIIVFLIAGIAKELGGRIYAQILAAIGFIISGYGMRTFALYMPVFLDVFFWTLVIYIVIRYVNTSSDKYLIYLGIAVGFSLMNKYLIGILFISFLIVVPFTRYRNIFQRRGLWTGFILAILIFSPNLIWQISKGLPVIIHMKELVRTQLVHVDKLGFLLDQFIMPAFASFITVSGLIYLMVDKNASKFRFLAGVIISVILLLLFLSGKSYYTIGIFPFLTAAGGVSYEKSLHTVFLRIALPVLLVLLTIPMLPFSLPIYKPEGLVTYFRVVEQKYGVKIGRRFEDGSIHSLPQDYADMLGWEELTGIAAKAWNKIEDKKAAFIFGDNYGTASAITILGKKYGLPDALSFGESYQYWIPEKFDPDIKSVVYINGRPGEDVKALFRKISLIGTISNRDAREYGTGVFLCEDPVVSFNSFWTERVIKFKKEHK